MPKNQTPADVDDVPRMSLEQARRIVAVLDLRCGRP